MEKNNTGATAVSSPEEIEIIRLVTILRGIELEMYGMKLSRGRNCSALARQELKDTMIESYQKLPRSKAKLYEIFSDYIGDVKEAYGYRR